MTALNSIISTLALNPNTTLDPTQQTALVDALTTIATNASQPQVQDTTQFDTLIAAINNISTSLLSSPM
jgi:hypothetical protein